MNCPYCGKEISSKLAAKALRSIKSESRAKASKENGKLGGRPKSQATICKTFGHQFSHIDGRCIHCGASR